MLASLSLPVVTAEEFDDYVPFELYLPRNLLRHAEALAEFQDANVGDMLVDLLSAALPEGGAA